MKNPVIALQIGKGTSVGVPGKNTREVLGRPLMTYSLMAAKSCPEIERTYISTDSSEIASIGGKQGATVIERPDELAQNNTLTEDVLVHALDAIRTDLGGDPQLIVLLLCNAAMVLPKSISQAIQYLRSHPDVDSVFSVSEFNMFSPIRAKKRNTEGLLESYVDLSQFDHTSSVRNEQENCYYAGLGLQVIRPRCIDEIEEGAQPIRWMGKQCYGWVDDFGFDIDADWQWPALEYWLKKQGFSPNSTPY